MNFVLVLDSCHGCMPEHLSALFDGLIALRLLTDSDDNNHETCTTQAEILRHKTAQINWNTVSSYHQMWQDARDLLPAAMLLPVTVMNN